MKYLIITFATLLTISCKKSEKDIQILDTTTAVESEVNTTEEIDTPEETVEPVFQYFQNVRSKRVEITVRDGWYEISFWDGLNTGSTRIKPLNERNFSGSIVGTIQNQNYRHQIFKQGLSDERHLFILGEDFKLKSRILEE